MRIAVVTANIGGFDPVFGMTKQTKEADYFYFNDSNLPFPLPGLDNRLKSKYIKIMMHRFLGEYDMYIWHDGRIRISANTFVETFYNDLIGSDIAIYKHRERLTIKEELNYILEKMKIGNEYLLKRYSNQQLEKELLFYEKNNTSQEQLYMSGVFARWNHEKINNACEEWWARTIEFSCFDQAMFSHIAKEKLLTVNRLQYDELRTHKLFEITKHLS